MESGKQISNIKKDEHVVFFRTTASLDPSGAFWNVPIHGWIYEPEDSRFRKRIISEIFQRKYDLAVTEENSATFSERLNLLIADNERGKRIVIQLGEQTVTLPKSKPNGHFRGSLELSLEEAEKIQKDGIIPFEAIVSAKDDRRYHGECLLQEEKGIGIISDIDDTVKVTHVSERKRLLEHTFFKGFTSVDGMAAFYQELGAKGASFHFVSSSPWQLYQPLTEFLAASGFPWGALTLKAVRFRDETLFNLFRKGTTTKPAQIKPILEAYPKRKFILIGDSGEHDPEVYGDIARKYSKNVLKILIRNISGESMENHRMQEAAWGTPASKWRLFEDPKTLDAEELIALQAH